MALRAGKHCYTQKPLTHSVSEARLLATLALTHAHAVCDGGKLAHELDDPQERREAA